MADREKVDIVVENLNGKNINFEVEPRDIIKNFKCFQSYQSKYFDFFNLLLI